MTKAGNGRAFLTRLVIGIAIATGAALGISQLAFAIGGSPAASPSAAATNSQLTQSIFSWAPGGDLTQNTSVGVAYAILGLIGALVTIYVFAGEYLPSMGGKADYELRRAELALLQDQRAKAYDSRQRQVTSGASAEAIAPTTALCHDLDSRIAREEQQLDRERWRLLAIAMPAYLILGGFFACAVATNYLQAILVGFGWTAVAQRIGLQRQMKVVIAQKNEAINGVVAAAQKELKTARRANRVARNEAGTYQKLLNDALGAAADIARRSATNDPGIPE